MKRLLAILLLVAAAALAWAVVRRLVELDGKGAAARAERLPVPVEVARVERGPIRLRRTFSGTLEAVAEFVVAPKVAGRLKSVAVDLGDEVERGQVLALIDDEEYVEAVKQAEADLAVARATEAEAASAREIAVRALQRVELLREDGVSSESELDVARAEEAASTARVEVARATVARAEAALEASRIRLGYTRVTADWSGGNDRRVVAERHVDEGGTVSANTALLSIVELDPIVGVVHVPERDYAQVRKGQVAELVTDTWPGRVFAGRVSRIAPVFRRATRQARVELLLANEGLPLKPGLFVRATLELDRAEDATLVPFDALTERDRTTGVFLLDETGTSVRWAPVEPGIREGERLAVTGIEPGGRVVTLGQALCEDGSRVSIVASAAAEPAAPAPER